MVRCPVGPSCVVSIKSDDGPTLDLIDAVLAAAADEIKRTRKGRVWDVWIKGRPIHVSVADNPPILSLDAGCNGREDYDAPRQISQALASALGGLAPEPSK